MDNDHDLPDVEAYILARVATSRGAPVLELWPHDEVEDWPLCVAAMHLRYRQEDGRLHIGGYEYTFLGQSEFAGIQVKRDRSDTLVWAGAGLILAGLLVTFWVPRRRLWAKIALGRTLLAGQAASHANYTRELRRLAREAGAAVPEEAEDDD